MAEPTLDGEEISGARTLVVGVKLDSQSRELLTWVLVKLAQPGDRVVALHVLNNNEIVDRDGKSSLLSLVKAFDSVLGVYEGFCNLKQVDLNLKVCRGSSIPKILVREAKTYLATELIVGTATKHHAIQSSSSVAKHCAKKLPKDCTVLAVCNGKILFHRGSSTSYLVAKETKDHLRYGLLGAIKRSFHKNPKVLDSPNRMKQTTGSGNPELALLRADSNCSENGLKQSCSICLPSSVVSSNSCVETMPSGDNDEDNSMAIVPVPKVKAASNSISLLRRKLPELRQFWPLLCRAILSNQNTAKRSSGKQISMIQSAMQLPSTHCLSVEKSDEEQSCDDYEKQQSSEFDGESGAIVFVSNESMSSCFSPDSDSKSLPKELEGIHDKYSATCRLFQYKELLSATSNFTPENMIGKGGSSQVFRGCLPDGKELAIKILKPTEDVLKEFILEIEIITALHHKNVIQLFGFCFEDNNLLLVYDFLSRGSLEEILHGHNKDIIVFGWNERYKVAVGVAEALDYLHNKIFNPVIHRDVKSSNILLSDDFEPQLSDFGLAKWAPTASSHITCTDVAGTFGYLAPEYFMYGKVNDKIDVYAFGVVLLELLSGRKPISSDYPKGQESLLMWAKPFLNGGKFAQVLDSSLGSDYDSDQMERMVLAAALCIRRASRARPPISIVLKLLQGDAEVTKWARLQVNASDSRLQIDALEGSEALDDEALSHANLKSYLNLALLDVEESSLSMSSLEQSVTLEDYLRGRWSRSSSLD